MLAFTITTILIVEKKEKAQKNTLNRILLVCAFSFPILVASVFLANSLFHSIAQGKLVLGGITWLGGVLVTFPILLILIHFFCPRIKGNALFYFNLIIPALALGHAFGRIGCFLGGCCYGGITDGILGVSLPPHSTVAHQQVNAGLIVHGEWSLPVYPTQLFEAGFEFLLFVGVLLVLYHKRIIFKNLHAKMDAYKKESETYGVHLGQDVKSTLKKLHALQENGMLTQAEYENAKSELKKRLYSPSQAQEPNDTNLPNP